MLPVPWEQRRVLNGSNYNEYSRGGMIMMGNPNIGSDDFTPISRRPSVILPHFPLAPFASGEYPRFIKKSSDENGEL